MSGRVRAGWVRLLPSRRAIPGAFVPEYNRANAKHQPGHGLALNQAPRGYILGTRVTNSGSVSTSPRLGALTVDDQQAELLVRLLSRHQDSLFRHIFALLPNEEDARDVLQETCVALLRKFSEYDPAKPFLPWAFRFAYLEVLKFRERTQREARLFSPELIEQLAREREAMESVLHHRLHALEECLRRLPPADQELIRQRYHLRVPIDELVRDLGWSRRSLFRQLDRVRRWLLDCISRRLEAPIF